MSLTIIVQVPRRFLLLRAGFPSVIHLGAPSEVRGEVLTVRASPSPALTVRASPSFTLRVAPQAFFHTTSPGDDSINGGTGGAASMFDFTEADNAVHLLLAGF